MPGKLPEIIRVYRIVHIDNVEYLLTKGMFHRYHPKADPDYINIGDSNLIEQRNTYHVGINPPNGLLGDYVPFYFGPLSPMLLNISTGYRGITKRSQSEIAYIVCNFNDVVAKCTTWCFTDGHAKNAITCFYNQQSDLDKIDWNIVFERFWKNTEEDYDKMRRKQAEFLVQHHVPASCIAGIIVYNEQAKEIIDNIVCIVGLNIPIVINPKSNYYY